MFNLALYWSVIKRSSTFFEIQTDTNDSLAHDGKEIEIYLKLDDFSELPYRVGYINHF